MTLRAPSYLQNGSYTGDQDRLLLQSLLGGSPNSALVSGIVSPGDYAVTQTGTASMVLDIASGSAFVVGNQSSTEGVYNVVNDDNTQTVTIATADGSHPRIDLVVLQIQNSEYSGTHDRAILTTVTGTPAASPVAPALPADAFELAQIAVGTGVTSITTANITDKRTIFNGAARGEIGYVQITSQQTAITTLTDITGLSVTVNIPAGRKIRVSAFCPYTGGGSGNDIYQVFIYEGSTQLTLSQVVSQAGYGGQSNPSVRLTPSAGSHTYKVSMNHTLGSDGGTFGASATEPAYLMVEDLGAA